MRPSPSAKWSPFRSRRLSGKACGRARSTGAPSACVGRPFMRASAATGKGCILPLNESPGTSSRQSAGVFESVGRFHKASPPHIITFYRGVGHCEVVPGGLPNKCFPSSASTLLSLLKLSYGAVSFFLHCWSQNSSIITPTPATGAGPGLERPVLSQLSAQFFEAQGRGLLLPALFS